MARIIDTPELDPVLFPNISVAGFLQHYVEDRIKNALAAEAGKQPAGTGTIEKGTQPAAGAPDGTGSLSADSDSPIPV